MTGNALNTHIVEWKAKRDIINAVIEAGGKVFGGAVRDWLIHDHYAKCFYEYIETKYQKPDNEINRLYMDPEFMPETNKRLTLPNDIDATINYADLGKLYRNMNEQNFTWRRVFNRDAIEYLPNLEVAAGDVRHMRYEITMIPLNLKTAIMKGFPNMLIGLMDEAIQAFKETFERITGLIKPIILDLMVVTIPSELSLPFGPLDFECNGLVASTEGIRLVDRAWDHSNPMNYDTKYRAITNDILNKCARISSISNIAKSENGNLNYRMSKMLSKGWTIEGFSNITRIPEAKATDGICVICHGDISDGHYKMKCCNLRYHLTCLVAAMQTGPTSMINTHACFMCKRKGAPNSYVEDLAVLEGIQEHFSEREKNN